MALILIGIDDTDNKASRGTGRLARLLSCECEKRGLQPVGVTRHQFLLDPAIDYTSHNSGACIGICGDDGIEAATFAFDFVAQRSAEGSDPGVCIARADTVGSSIVEFAKAANKKLLKIEDAFNLARADSIALQGLGGSCQPRLLEGRGQGVIGALASVGLRAAGVGGRFIDLPGLRELPRCVDAQTYNKMGIEIEYKSDCRQLSSSDMVDGLGWVRPRLISGKPVLVVEWSEQKNAWVPVDRKKGRALG